MRSSSVILENLISHCNKEDYKYKRLYRILFNENLYLTAYQNIYAKEGNMTPGTDGESIDGFKLEKIKEVIGKLQDCSYQPNPAKRVYIPKKNGKKRPLGIQSFMDKLLQEVIRMILECIYEETFLDCSHGFRPNRSCHTALRQAKTVFTGVKWFVEGDIEGFFDNIDHKTLVDILRRKIDDERFINLIQKFLKAGYLEDWVYHSTYSGTPQGGIISPILSNIYLNELDRYVTEFKEKFDCGDRRKRNTAYRTASKRLCTARNKLKANWDNLTDEQRKEQQLQIKKLEQELLTHSPTISQDESYKRLVYVRYADDFLIGIIGSKEDAKFIKFTLTEFLNQKLKLRLSQEKTLITHSETKVKFLGYEIKVKRDNSTKRINGSLHRGHNLIPELYMPKSAWEKRLFDENIAFIDRKTGQWKAKARAELIFNDDLEIMMTYNTRIRGLYQYYQMAVNVCQLDKYKYFSEYSMYKTFGKKYKLSIGKVKNKFCVKGKFCVRYQTKNGEKLVFFYDEGFKRNLKSTLNSIDLKAKVEIYSGRTSLIDRLKSQKCEWCGKENTPINIHHIRKLKDLKGKTGWEKQMISRNRKTMALCEECHKKLHSGRLD
ncbi:reverse transcriptase/maturase family protein [Tissierella sp. MSJ-40]|uniref:Reverse transcriptase/maturase family protein n=1 Tax=Tissierella simiarum TaxID=2841534 RepID=A0ABS6E9Z0_9FIRM|nr:reverse transcriptase/maturase family protein [Tissierella simiarum]MBU5439747.1 reverse transcriptase/maturase family protein [Tissierella simiarum]